MNDFSFYSFLNDPLWWGVIIPNGKFNNITSNFKAQGTVIVTKLNKQTNNNITTQHLAFLLQNTSNLWLLLMCVYFAMCLCFPNCKLEYRVCPVAILDNNLETFDIKEARCRNTVDQSLLTFKTSVIGPASFSILQLPSKMTFTLLFQYTLLLLTLFYFSSPVIVLSHPHIFFPFPLISDST